MQDQVYKSLISKNEAISWYNYLSENVRWEEGIKTRHGTFTRLAKAIGSNEHPEIVNFVHRVAYQILPGRTIVLHGIYLNLYIDGNMYTPNHKHPGTQQMVISLGATRSFNLGTQKFPVENGDVLLFGSTNHGVPKESNVKDGRISIACFLQVL